MRVLIDAHMIGAQETGNETYIVNLLKSLPKLRDMEFGAAVEPGRSHQARFENVELVPLRKSGKWRRLLQSLPSICRDWRADLLHVTYVAPFWTPCPFVVTVHDVAFKRHPEFFSPRDRLLFSTLLPCTLWRASAVLTVSRHAMKEILDIYPFLSGKVHVTPNAPSEIYRPIAEDGSNLMIQSRYGIKSQFILAVGNLQPRKNLIRLVSAFASIRHQAETSQLVIVGKAQWKSSAVFDLVQRLGVEEDVIFTGYVPDQDLVLLYNSAKVFAYPSVYEGFGLPILEAMACGTPVITSNTSSMPEVAGDAAMLVDPYSETDIAQALVQVLSDATLASSLTDRGLRQVQRYSWHDTALKTTTVYRRVCCEQQHP